VFGPAKVPAPVVERLYREFSKVLQTSDIKQRFEQLGITPSGMAPADFAEFQRQEIAKWSAVIKAANITVD
jgi:tripartite-type tricarboxylate transporter receptor subunit TctC